ncbi:MAG: hypothetical protein ABJP70_07480 [Erythrobacter sp.]
MSNMGRNWLVGAALLSAVACFIHIATIFGGGDWYRFFGAGEEMAKLDEAGSWRPAIITVFISAVLAGWVGYALSGAGVIFRLPLLRTALIAISAVLFMRAALYFAPQFWRPEHGSGFILWSSLAVLVLGLAFAIGTALSWRRLSRAPMQWQSQER